MQAYDGDSEAMSWRPRMRGDGAGNGVAEGGEGGAGMGNGTDAATAAIWEEANAIDDEVKQYLQYFRARFRERATEEIHTLYEDNFVRLSEKYYKNSPWPSAAAVAYLVQSDEEFLLFYRELANRHLYARGVPSIGEQIESWESYIDLFSAFLRGDMAGLDLPASWMWDVVDEFIYQFEVWCQYRSKLKDRDEAEIAVLRENEHLWSVNEVLQYLHALVNKSNVCPWMLNGNQPVGNTDPAAEDFDLSSLAIYRYIGFFSIVGLLRIHCLLSDYRLALMVLQSLDFNPQTSLFTHVTACHISVYYFMGFANLMLRRYEDAGKVFGSTLLQIGRIKQSHVRSYQYEQVNKRIDQMLALLAICTTFQPQYTDESTSTMLKEKFGDKLTRMRAGEETAFMELFMYACPKFINPAPPNYDVIADYHMEAAKLQHNLFMAEVQQQLLLPEVRSYLKMYTTIEMSKLANLMDTNEEAFRSHLLCLKHKSYSGRAEESYVTTPTLQGADYNTSSDIAFYVDGDVVHVVDAKVETRYGEFFVRNIDKLTDLSRTPISREAFQGTRQAVAVRQKY